MGLQTSVKLKLERSVRTTYVTLDVMQPLQAYDAGGRARAFSGVVKALSKAKAAGLSEEQAAKALTLVGWEGPADT